MLTRSQIARALTHPSLPIGNYTTHQISHSVTDWLTSNGVRMADLFRHSSTIVPLLYSNNYTAEWTQHRLAYIVPDPEVHGRKATTVEFVFRQTHATWNSQFESCYALHGYDTDEPQPIPNIYKPFRIDFWLWFENLAVERYQVVFSGAKLRRESFEKAVSRGINHTFEFRKADFHKTFGDNAQMQWDTLWPISLDSMFNASDITFY